MHALVVCPISFHSLSPPASVLHEWRDESSWQHANTSIAPDCIVTAMVLLVLLSWVLPAFGTTTCDVFTYFLVDDARSSKKKQTTRGKLQTEIWKRSAREASVKLKNEWSNENRPRSSCFPSVFSPGHWNAISEPSIVPKFEIDAATNTCYSWDKGVLSVSHPCSISLVEYCPDSLHSHLLKQTANLRSRSKYCILFQVS